MDVLFSLFFSEQCCFHFDFQKRLDCVTYVTVKELGGNHFAEDTMTVFVEHLRNRRDPALPASDRPVHFVTDNYVHN